MIVNSSELGDAMSSSSLSLADTQRQEKLAAELKKWHAQARVLRDGVLSERAKAESYKEELRSKEAAYRKLKDENESLLFRNQQLSCRVESLVDELSALTQTKTKKSKDTAPLLLQLESSKRKIQVLEDELANKLTANEVLTSKICDLEKVILESSVQQRPPESESENQNSEEEKLDYNRNANLRRNSQISIINANSKMDKRISDSPQPHWVSDDCALFASESSANDRSQLVYFIRSAASGVSNAFQLFAQRSELYPFDSHLEHVPENLRTLSTKLNDCSVRFGEIVRNLDSIIESREVKIPEDLLAICCSSRILDHSMIVSLQLLLNHLRLEENKVTYVDSKIEYLNQRVFCAFNYFIVCLGAIWAAVESLNIDTVLSALHSLSGALRAFYVAYTERWVEEKRFPSTTKRLSCVSEALCDCLKSLVMTLSELAASVSFILPTETPICTNGSHSISNSHLPKVNESTSSSSMEPMLIAYVQKATQTEQLGENLRVFDDFDELKKNLKILEAEREKLERELLQAHADLQRRPLEPPKPSEEMSAVLQCRQQAIKDRVRAESSSDYYMKECQKLVFTVLELQKKLQQVDHKLTETVSKRDKLKDELDVMRNEYNAKMASLSNLVVEQNSMLAGKGASLEKKESTSRIKSFFK